MVGRRMGPGNGVGYSQLFCALNIDCTLRSRHCWYKGPMHRILGTLLLVASACYGQCPLKFIKIIPFRTESWSRVGRSLGDGASKLPPDFSMRVQNVSTKEIRGLKVQAAYFDTTEDLHLLPDFWNWEPNIKAGIEKTLDRESPQIDTKAVGWVVVPIKVLFADGTKWEAPDSVDSMKDCFGEYWRSKKHPRLTKLPLDFFESGKR